MCSYSPEAWTYEIRKVNNNIYKIKNKKNALSLYGMLKYSHYTQNFSYIA